MATLPRRTCASEPGKLAEFSCPSIGEVQDGELWPLTWRHQGRPQTTTGTIGRTRTSLPTARLFWNVGPPLEIRDVQSLAVIGKIFRCLICINLEAPSFALEWVENAVRDMRIYQAAMADAIQEAGWER